MPLLAIALLALLIIKPLFGAEGTGPIFFSEKGPGSMHAPLMISLAAGLLVGWLAQGSRFCTVGAIRDLIMLKDTHLFKGILCFIIAAFLTNIVLGQFKAGFEGQPIAHTMHLWNFLGMVLSGLAFTLAGGCPGRMFIMSGEGDSDAGVFIMGMLVGAAFAHNFSLASSGTGVGAYGFPATIAGLVFCLAVGQIRRAEEMETKTVDARGLSCPQPVVEAKKVLDKVSGGRIEILVDTVTSRENVLRFGRNAGWKGTFEETDGTFKVILEK